MTRFQSSFACMLTASLVLLAACHARAQTDFPNRPIHFIVGFAVGGGNDLLARLVLQKFQQNTGATVVIENKVALVGASLPTTPRISLLTATRYWSAPPDRWRSQRRYITISIIIRPRVSSPST
jgi:hypothetical protein